MNNLQVLTQSETMSSLQIAEMTGLLHKNVLRDIRNLAEQVEEFSELKFEPSSYINSQNKVQPMYNLTKKESLLLASGYNPRLRLAIINRWEELETQSRYALSQAENNSLKEQIAQQNEFMLKLQDSISTLTTLANKGIEKTLPSKKKSRNQTPSYHTYSSRSRYICFNNRNLTLSEWQDATGIHRRTIGRRLERGWSIHKSLTTGAKFEPYKSMPSESEVE